MRLTNWRDDVRNHVALPLRVELWNGQQLDFSGHAPKVTIRVPRPSSLRYLLSPSLYNLGSAYVEGAIDVTGRAADMIAIVNALAAATLQKPGLIKIVGDVVVVADRLRILF